MDYCNIWKVLIDHIGCWLITICATIIIVVVIKEAFKNCRHSKEIKIRTNELKLRK